MYKIVWTVERRQYPIWTSGGKSKNRKRRIKMRYKYIRRSHRILIEE